MDKPFKMSLGRIIVVEGLDGVGKTTVVDYIEGWLLSRKLDVHRGREPGGTEFAEKVRDLFKSELMSDVPLLAQSKLLNAARIDHLVRVINPARMAGQTVLLDRFTLSTLAYQFGSNHGINTEVYNECLRVLELYQATPTYTFYLTMDLDLIPERLANRADADWLDRVPKSILEKRRLVMDEYINDCRISGNAIEIDANNPIMTVLADVTHCLERIYKTTD